MDRHGCVPIKLYLWTWKWEYSHHSLSMEDWVLHPLQTPKSTDAQDTGYLESDGGTGGLLFSCSVVSDPFATRLLCPWNFPAKNIGVSYHFLLQGIFLTRD